jgi:hypothetical protein
MRGSRACDLLHIFAIFVEQAESESPLRSTVKDDWKERGA